MTMTLEQMMAAANEAAQTSVDMTEAQAGGSAKPFPIGNALARLIGVVELGEHMQKDFTTKKPKGLAEEIRLTFALWGTGKLEDGTPANFHNDDGTPRIWSPFDIVISRNAGSNAFRMFQKLNWRGDKTSFAQLINGTWILPFAMMPKTKTDPTLVHRLNIDAIIPPLDPITQAPYPVPEVDISQYRMFLWDKPNKAAWDALYVEGEWPAKDGKPAESKNKIQNKILAAANFSGSPLEVLLGTGGAGLALPGATEAPVTVVAPAAVPTPVAPVAAVVAPAVAVPEVVAPLAVPAAAAVPAVAPAGVQAPVTPAAPVVAVPSSPVLPA